MPLDSSNCVATYKILVLGDASVGKTAILRRLTGRDYQERLLPTIATDFVKKSFEVDGALVELQIWDTAGQERFRSVTRWQYRGVKGVAMIYDITDKETFTHLSYWIHSVNQEISHTHNKYETVPIVLIGNKADLEGQRQVRLKDGAKLADKEMAFAFHETSAKTGQNVFDAFRKLAYHVTEICNPNVMKSYHPYMIRNPAVTMDTLRKNFNIMGHTGHVTISQTVVFSSRKQKAEIKPEIVKLKQTQSKRKRGCCMVK